jgi:hypothetical protein
MSGRADERHALESVAQRPQVRYGARIPDDEVRLEEPH